MSHSVSRFITDELENERCGRFVDSRKASRITFPNACIYDVINMMNNYDVYDASLRNGYLMAFDILYKYLDKNPDDEIVKNDVRATCFHSLYDRHDGLLYVYMFMMHHVIELHLKCFCEAVFGQNETGHKCDVLWAKLKGRLDADGHDVSYFDGFFSDKEKCCNDGFSGRYYKSRNGKQYLTHTLYIDIGSIHFTVHEFIDKLTEIVRTYSAVNKDISPS